MKLDFTDVIMRGKREISFRNFKNVSTLIWQESGPEKRALSPLHGCKTCLTMMKGVCPSSGLVPIQMAHSKDMLGTQTAPKRGILGLFLTDSDTHVGHLQSLFLAGTVAFM